MHTFNTDGMTVREVGMEIASRSWFEPMVGMRFLRDPSGAPDDCGDVVRFTESEGYFCAGFYPDLHDAATFGCILAVTEMRVGQVSMHRTEEYSPWTGTRFRHVCTFRRGDGFTQAQGDTRIHALASAPLSG